MKICGKLCLLFLGILVILMPFKSLDATNNNPITPITLIDQFEISNSILNEISVFSQTSISDPFLNELAQDTWNYMSSDWATSNHLPWSWRSASVTGGDYVNPAEIGLYALSWIIAYDMQDIWSPNWAKAEGEVNAILDQLRAWQTGSQSEQPNGPNAYNNSVFYQWYYVSSNPPVVGTSTDDHLVPSIDNAWLAASLITIREYAEANDHPLMAQKADAILQDMDFTLWYHPDTHRFSWGATEDPLGGTQADYYSNENRLINFVARAMGHISSSDFYYSLQALQQPPGTYAGITVEKLAWDGSYFTYASPALFIKEMDTDYGINSITPAAQAQMAYAIYNGYDAWGFSDCFDVGVGEYVQQGAPPAATPDDPETRHGLLTAHASALALITPLATDVITNLQTIATTYDCAYDDMYGFRDSVMSDPSAGDYGQCSERFSILAQEWIFLALADYNNGFVWDYFYRDIGVQNAHLELAGIHQTFLPFIITPPPTPPLIVANFDTCNHTNNLGGLMGAAYNLPDFMMEQFIPMTGRGCVAKLDYDIKNWAAFWMKLQYSNLTDYNTLTFDIKSEIPAPGDIKIELKRFCSGGDCGEISIRRVTGIDTNWRTFTVSMADFGPTGFPGIPPLSSWENIEELVFTFESDHAGNDGVVYIDNVRFENREFEGLQSNSLIAFSAYPNGINNTDIYTVSIDGQEIKNLTSTPFLGESSPDWSSDGSKIAFTCKVDGNNDICIMNADGTGWRNITNHSSDDFGPVWSPDMNQIVFTSDRSGNRDIYRINLDGSGLINLTNHSSTDDFPDWVCPGGNIVFNSHRNGSYDIYSMEPDGSNVVQMTHLANHTAVPRWSPDCSKISFMLAGDDPTDLDEYEIYVMSADGLNVTNITQNLAYEASPASWSPNGDAIVYLSRRNGQFTLYISSTIRYETMKLTTGQVSPFNPDWSPVISTQQ